MRILDRRTRLAGSLLAATIVVAACGGSAASPAASTPASPAATPAGSADGSTPAPSAPSGPLALAKDLPALSPAETIKIRVGSSLTTAPVWYALEKGYFEQLGIEIEIVEIQSSGDIPPAISTGQLDIAGTSFGSGLYNAIQRDVNVIAVADNGQLDKDLAGSAAVVKAGTLAGYGDDWCALEGKKVAIAGKTTGLWVTLVKALESCDLTVDDVEVIELGFGETTPAVENGAVDVAFHVEPFIAGGVAQGLLEVWKPLDEAREGQQMNIVLMSPGFFEQRRDTALRFLVAYLAGTREYLADAQGGDRGELGEILAKHLAIKDPAAYKDMIMMGIDPEGAIDVESVEETLGVFQDDGSVPPGDLDLSWIDDDLREEALSYLP